MHKAILRGSAGRAVRLELRWDYVYGADSNTFARFVYRFRTPAFHVGKTGSIPVSCTISKRKSVGGVTDYQTIASHMLLL